MMADRNPEIDQKFADYVCPDCKVDLESYKNCYHCPACDRNYPILFGIPDFRIRSDRYLTLQQEREKARKLYEFGKTASFDELLDFYYSITDDVPEELAVRYKAYIKNAPLQAQLMLKDLDLSPDKDVLLDLGCGAGGLLITVAGRCRSVVGVDIALRWLVICQKRLLESGVKATLLCADAEALPFRHGKVTRVVAGDVIEHVYDPVHMLRECQQHLVPGGRLWLSATNRYCLGPNALTRVWWIGFFPRAVRSRILLRLRGVDSLRYINLVSPVYIKRLLKEAGFRLLGAGPRRVGLIRGVDYPLQDRVLIRIYQLMLRSGFLSYFLMLIGPAFETICVKKVNQKVSG